MIRYRDGRERRRRTTQSDRGAHASDHGLSGLTGGENGKGQGGGPGEGTRGGGSTPPEGVSG